MILAVWLAFGKKRILWNTTRLVLITAFLAGVLSLFPEKSTIFLCFFAVLTTIVGSFLMKKFIFEHQTNASIYAVSLCFLSKTRVLYGFLDSGNRLRLPGSSLPVLVADEKLFREWLALAHTFCPQKLCVLPFHGVGGKGLLKGIKMGARMENQQEYTEVAVVMAEHSLFRKKEYQMLLQTELLSQQKKCMEGEHHVI